MKKIFSVIIVIAICLLFTGCNDEQQKFSLEEKYYEKSGFTELKIEDYNKLIEGKESFAIFIYQPLCITSYEFNKVLTEFSKKHQINFYKMTFNDMKETNLGESIEYYPSFVIIKDGELVDYLDANSDEDTEYYKNVEGFKEWFSSYVNVEEVENYGSPSDDEVNEDTKIDAKLEDVTYNENKINIYFFWGNGCNHCKNEFKFWDSIETEYGDYFTLHTFEVWGNQDNAELLNQFANAMGDEVKGVPYTIIGKETFTGFSEDYEENMLNAIKNQYKNSYDVYFDETKKIESR